MQYQVGFNVNNVSPTDPDTIATEQASDVLQKTSSMNSSKLLARQTSILSQQLKRMQERKASASMKIVYLQKALSVGKPFPAQQSSPSDKLHTVNRSNSYALPIAQASRSQVQYEEMRSEDHNALYGLRYDAVGKSGVLSQEEIEAMTSVPLPPAVGSFPDAVIDRLFK